MYSIQHNRTQSVRLGVFAEPKAVARPVAPREGVLQRAEPSPFAWQRGVYALILLALIGSAQAYTRIGGIARTSATQVA